VTARLGWSPHRAIAIDSNPVLTQEARKRHALQVVQSELDCAPLASGSVNAVCVLDVFADDVDPHGILLEAKRLLSQGGHLIVNVPGHPWLWSTTDVALRNRRRYTRATLRSELEAAGFEVVWCSHVFSWLVLPVWLLRWGKSRAPRLGIEFEAPFIDRLALILGWIERMFLRFSTLPLGTSVLAIARQRPLRAK
jgi:hypothetical protein